MFFLLHSALTHAATPWHTLAPGIEYVVLEFGDTDDPMNVHAFRIDPARHKLDVVLAKDFGLSATSVREMGQRARAVVAVNGGFFSPEFHPLGLRIAHGAVRNALKDTSWWGVFFMRGTHAQIVAKNDFHAEQHLTMAVQAGPRLVVNGQIPNLKGGEAQRTGIGITRDGKIVIASTEEYPISTEEFAQLFRKSARDGGLDCPNALNLDGGSSSQIFAQLGAFHLNVPNLGAVTDAVVVVGK